MTGKKKYKKAKAERSAGRGKADQRRAPRPTALLCAVERVL